MTKKIVTIYTGRKVETKEVDTTPKPEPVKAAPKKPAKKDRVD